tara:strand:+ start:233 stop:562 length:330 start_codon:yes stop_codon:yes gene_type:complete
MADCIFTRSGIEMEAGLKPGQLDSGIVSSVVDMTLQATRDARNWYESGASSEDGEEYAEMIEDSLKDWAEQELSYLCEKKAQNSEVYTAAYSRAESAVKTYVELLRRVK